LFEDDYLAVIHKPAGILVSGNTFATITNGLSQHLKKSTQPDAVKPQPIHRLDYPTSGVLLIGKTSATIHALSKLFENKKIEKTYWAITIGQMKKAGEINFPIDEKEALSIFKVIHTVTSKRFSRLNLVELKPKTGRKHQLRKHLLSIGNPILGDKKYFLDQKILNGKGLYLHASTLELRHPITKEKLVITQELPKKFKTIFTEQKAN
jgi:23S rRNA pseudouridine1911/1915/1917 synthase